MAFPSDSTQFGQAALDAGALAVVSSAFIGVGSLAYYGLGFSRQTSALNNISSSAWSEEVKTKIQHIYIYFYISFYIAMIFAYIAHSDPTLRAAFSSLGMIVVDFCVEILVDSGNAFARLRNEGCLCPQKLAWTAYCAFLGGITSPNFYRDPSTMRIAIHTTLIIASTLILLSLVAPVGKFTKWRPQLQIFELIVLISAVCTNLLPVTTSLGALFISISFYGGLILCSLNILYYCQKGQLEATQTPEGNQEVLFNSMAVSVPLLTNTLSIFNRIVAMVPFETLTNP